MYLLRTSTYYFDRTFLQRSHIQSWDLQINLCENMEGIVNQGFYDLWKGTDIFSTDYHI